MKHPARFIQVALATVLCLAAAALGERMHAAPVAQAGIAATLAAFMGRDYRAAVPAAAPPIRDVLAGDVPARDVPAKP